MVNNANESEPWFLVLALAYTVCGTPPAWGVTALYTFCFGRIAHCVIYLTPFPECILPYHALARASAWLVGTLTMIVMAGSALQLW